MPAANRVLRFYTEDLKLRASAVVTTDVVRKMATMQGTQTLATKALGQTLTGALLLASQLGEQQRLSLTFQGDGVLGNLFAEATFEGEARGYCYYPDAKAEGSGLGQGPLSVMRTIPFQKHPFVSLVPITDESIEKTLANYLMQSSQVASFLSLAVETNQSGALVASGGVLIELLPAKDEVDMQAVIEKKISAAVPLAARLLEGVSERELVESFVHDVKLIEGEPGGIITYSCRCNMERVERTLSLLGTEALKEMVEEARSAAVKCEFCRQDYIVPLERLKELLRFHANPNLN